MTDISTVNLDTDILIIGGGAAGCMAAIEAKKTDPNIRCIIMEKAHIERSGCLAMGLNAINAYLNNGQTPEKFTKYISDEFCGVIREDLVYSIAEGLNESVKQVEDLGLPIEKDQNGDYVTRGRRSIRIFGERLKPILAAAVYRAKVGVLNRVAATNFIFDGERVKGAYGFSNRDGKLYVVHARAVIVTTGGASGIYKPIKKGDARNTTWYCPWNVGTGYAMGIRIGAEMTSFENRFVPLRVKGVNAPTGTIAQGSDIMHRNALGEEYLEDRYKHLGGEKCLSIYRLLGTLQEEKAGKGPCYLDTGGLSVEAEEKLKMSYLNMNPAIVLLWANDGYGPSKRPVEISGMEPVVIGGHCQAGYWIDIERRTTIDGLYAAGDVAGGAPKKYVSGAWVEAKIAVKTAIEEITNVELLHINEDAVNNEKGRILCCLNGSKELSHEELEISFHEIMDEYAGGVTAHYELTETKLIIARDKLKGLEDKLRNLRAEDNHGVVSCMELIDKFDVAKVLIEHLIYRQETRWPIFQTRLDYPERDDINWLGFVNSVFDPVNDKVKIIKRALNETLCNI
ncbi:succinate dehydrogenase/fumarate reductase, flavoprotein subunit [Candidatus Scalindua japonica]|uniref:Succinate dehydrogenase/fumarate reductase, flavoprotein subunit n=1 Tax=Candidatus Scalindua japonica TaxID=1284222 RepID=A0A286U0I8_9BACT|nr:adenylyl-sulfate reductase subunit alpha [Candidatus Scalindua japonica]GAX61663.1 succinate dehydrogenase/fumarate reductase, flavoprotein subunit [Candidatus Scalindua japonica]